MAKLIIYVTGKPLIYGYRRQEFHWSEEHKCYIYLGRELDEAEFNEHAVRALRNYVDMIPSVRIVSKPTKPVSGDELSFEPRVISVEEAVAVLQREAPQLLKKTPARTAASVT